MNVENQPNRKQDLPILTDVELQRLLKRYSPGDLQALRQSIFDKRGTSEKLNELESACQQMDNEEARSERRDWRRGF